MMEAAGRSPRHRSHRSLQSTYRNQHAHLNWSFRDGQLASALQCNMHGVLHNTGCTKCQTYAAQHAESGVSLQRWQKCLTAWYDLVMKGTSGDNPQAWERQGQHTSRVGGLAAKHPRGIPERSLALSSPEEQKRGARHERESSPPCHLRQPWNCHAMGLKPV